MVLQERLQAASAASAAGGMGSLYWNVCAGWDGSRQKRMRSSLSVLGDEENSHHIVGASSSFVLVVKSIASWLEFITARATAL